MRLLDRLSYTLREEAAPTLRLAGPVVLGQLGLMLMGLVDTKMVAGLGDVAIGAVAIGGAVFYVLFMGGLGLLMGLDRLASVAAGARRFGELRRIHVQGQWLALATGLLLTGLGLLIAEEMHRLAENPVIAREAAGYVRAISWSFVPALMFTANRQVLQAMDDVRVATALMLLANGVNALANQWFIYGGPFNAPMGAEGAGWATTASRVFLLLALAAYTAWRNVGGVNDLGQGTGDRVERWEFGLDRDVLSSLVKLGLPAAGHLLLEVGVFALATFVAERMGTAALAAHQVVLLVASFTFMVPLGLSFAGAVRVGQAVGRGDPVGAKRAGWAAVLLAVGFMAASGLTLSLLGSSLMRAFGVSEEVVAIGARVIVLAAIFQVFDGAQVSLAGVLRGAGDTTSTMWANLAGHWLVGMPLGLWLGFTLGLGPVGLWGGLAAGLASVAVLLTFVWWKRTA